MYYILKNAAGTKETGSDYPQIADMVGLYDYDVDDSIHKVADYQGVKIPIPINFGVIKMRSKSKFSDIISAAVILGMGLIVSKRVKLILESVKLVDHEFYPLKIQHKGSINEDYFWVHIISDLRNEIDYSRSTFFSGRSEGVRNLTFNSFHDYIKYDKEQDEFGSLRATKLFFHKDWQNDLDLFCISEFDKNIYISQTLLLLLRKNSITGFEAPLSKILI